MNLFKPRKLFFYLIFITSIAKGQTIPDTLYFYGYDYSHFKLVEPKRTGEDIKNFAYSWIAYCSQRFTEQSMSVYTEKKVYVNYSCLSETLNNVDGTKLVGHEESLSEDSIISYIKRYKLDRTNGTALVVIPNTFNKHTKKSSAYFAFFDLNTRRLIRLDKHSEGDADGIGLTNYWGQSIAATTKKYLVKIIKEDRKYNKKRPIKLFNIVN